MNFKRLFSYVLAVFVINIYSLNSQATEPEKFIQLLCDEASTVLSNNITKDEKSKALIAIAKKSVDIRGIGFYTLGSHRKTLSDTEKKKYTLLFEKYFLKSFSSRLTDYTDPKINVISSEKKSEKYTIVSSVLLAKDERPEVKIDWRVYTKDPNNPLIRDLIIEGLSLARTQKEEFNSIIQSGGGDINALFSSLEQFINK